MIIRNKDFEGKYYLPIAKALDVWRNKQLKQLDRKARSARNRAARGWSPAYQGSCIDWPHQLYPLDPIWEVPFLRLLAPIRLLEIDIDSRA